jgi:hypothetical protein
MDEIEGKKEEKQGTAGTMSPNNNQGKRVKINP